METTIAGGGFWQAALIWGAVAAVLVWVLARTVRHTALGQVRWAVPAAAALFWGVFATALVYGLWGTYYEHFYSSRLRLIIPIYAPLLYAAVGTLLWWAARRLPGKPAVTFCLLGGLESLAEHGVAIYGLDILDRVPLLQGSDPLAVFAFAFPEYVVYWGAVLGLAALLARFRLRGQTRSREGSRHV